MGASDGAGAQHDGDGAGFLIASSRRLVFAQHAADIAQELDAVGLAQAAVDDAYAGSQSSQV